MSQGKRVLVTGATGFIAGHIVHTLLGQGYSVRGTTRKLRELPHLSGCELVCADLEDDAGWDAAMAGMDSLVHTASPVPQANPTDEQELIRPAVEGTRRVLEAAARAGIERVVVTSSTAAVVTGNEREDPVTEAHWSTLEHCSAYAKSKTLAERAAWELAERHGLRLSTLNPSVVVGPLLTDHASASMQLVRGLLSRAMPAVPKLCMNYVDVRDVAEAHRLALELPEAVGKRFLLTAGTLYLREVSEILARHFAAEGFRPPTWTLPYPLMWLVARFDGRARRVLGDLDRRTAISADQARTVLGWSPRDLDQTLHDAGRSLIDRGVVSA